MEFIEILIRRRIFDLFNVTEGMEKYITDKMLKFIKKTNKFIALKNKDLNKDNCIKYTDCNVLLRVDLILANTFMHSLNKYVNTDTFCSMYKEYIPIINENNLIKLFIFHKVLYKLDSCYMTDVFIDFRYKSSSMINIYISIFETIKDIFKEEEVNEKTMSDYIYESMYRGFIC